MRRERAVLLGVLALAAVASLGGECGGGSGEGGEPVEFRLKSPDARCSVLSGAFPPGFDFVPGGGGRLFAVNFQPPALVPFEIEDVPPRIPDPDLVVSIPADSDSDGVEEGSFSFPLAPILDDVFVLAPDLGIATASGYEELIFFRPDAGRLRSVEVAVPAAPFVPGDHPFLPAPGTSATRTGVSTVACLRPPLGALDSRGDPVAVSIPAGRFCDPNTPSYFASFTSGVARAGGHLFVSVSNLGSGAGTVNPQFLPGAVLVYDFTTGADPPIVGPDPDQPFVSTSGFNATHVTPYRAGGRDFVLVTVTGALGIERDDPGSTQIEGGGVALTEGAIDVIDAGTLELVATYPLGRGAPSFDELAIDPTGRVAVTGSAVGRFLYAVDLAPLAALPASPGTPVVLADAVIFDADDPFEFPALLGGGSASCPGFAVGAAFDHAGRRLYATDFCDGTLAIVGVALPASASVPVAQDDFTLEEVTAVVEPVLADTFGLPRALGSIAVRPGEPGVDFQGPDVVLLVGEPEGLVCGIRIASP